MRRRLPSKVSRQLALALLLSWSLASAPVLAEAAPVEIQVVLIWKILMFDRSVPKGTPTPFLVVYGDEKAGADEMSAVLRRGGREAKVVKAAELGAVPAGHIVYFFPKGVSSASSEAVIKAGAISFGSEAAMAERGEVAVGIRLKEGKPEIVVNLKVVKAQGHDLSSDFLNLATVIR